MTMPQSLSPYPPHQCFQVHISPYLSLGILRMFGLSANSSKLQKFRLARACIYVNYLASTRIPTGKPTSASQVLCKLLRQAEQTRAKPICFINGDRRVSDADLHKIHRNTHSLKHLCQIWPKQANGFKSH